MIRNNILLNGLLIRILAYRINGERKSHCACAKCLTSKQNSQALHMVLFLILKDIKLKIAVKVPASVLNESCTPFVICDIHVTELNISSYIRKLNTECIYIAVVN